MPGKQIGGYTGQGYKDPAFDTEEFNAHNGTGDRGIGSTGKYGYKSHSGQKSCRKRNKQGQCISEGSPDKEQGGHFPSFEACSQRKCRKEYFKQKIVRRKLVFESLHNSGDTQPYVFCSPYKINNNSENRSSDDRS